MGWILLVALLLVIYRYFCMRIQWEKTTYVRAFLGTYIYDKLFLVMAFAGVILFILQKCHVFVIPDSVERLHLFRTGIISFAVYCFFVWWDGSLDEETNIVEGEERNKDDSFLDKGRY